VRMVPAGKFQLNAQPGGYFRQVHQQLIKAPWSRRAGRKLHIFALLHGAARRSGRALRLGIAGIDRGFRMTGRH